MAEDLRTRVRFPPPPPIRCKSVNTMTYMNNVSHICITIHPPRAGVFVCLVTYQPLLAAIYPKIPANRYNATNMPIPDYQTLMLPLLRLAEDEQEHKFRYAVETLAQEFALTDVELSELLPSGSQPVFSNRVGWARTYLKKAGWPSGVAKTRVLLLLFLNTLFSPVCII